MDIPMVDVLAFGAHPDDLEFGCGGILAKMSSQKKSIVMVDLTLGDKGTNGTPEGRRQESIAAAKVIGAERVFMDFKDCEVFDSYESRLKFVEVIRTYKPRLILAPEWKGEMNHPDHLACGILARYACRYARFGKILPNLPVHTPEGILHYTGAGSEMPDFLIDISDQVEQWKQMMACHESQLRTHSYMEWVLKKASWLGVLTGGKYAQGLIKGNPVIIDDPMSVARVTREL